MLPIRFATGLLLLGLCTPTWGQSLIVESTISDYTHIDVGLGEIVEIEIRADLSGHAATGLSFYVKLPAGPFAIIDQGGHAMEGVRPWLPGSLFAGAMETENCLVIGREAGLNQQLLAYSLILGPGKSRSRSGKSVVGRFQFMSKEPIDNARIEVFSNPVHDSFLVLEDGLTERRFRGLQDLEVSAFRPTLVHTRDSRGAIKTRYAAD